MARADDIKAVKGLLIQAAFRQRIAYPEMRQKLDPNSVSTLPFVLEFWLLKIFH